MRRLAEGAWRVVIILHRWIGVVLGLLILGWCLSGVVMMYVPFPALEEGRRLSALQPVDLETCCSMPVGLDAHILEAPQVEMLAGHVVLRTKVEGENAARLFDLTTGEALEGISHTQALAVADEFGAAQGYVGAPRIAGQTMIDQWTVEGAFRVSAPFLTIVWDDLRAPVLYVSRRTGKAVQWTEGQQRFWNYLGSIPHWIYFLPLREHPKLWSNIVVWASLTGVVLTATGLTIVLAQWQRKRAQGRSLPCRGTSCWHHLAGTLFGLLLLSWVTSGLFSMNPWGFLEGESLSDEQSRLAGKPLRQSDVSDLLEVLRRTNGTQGVSIEISALNGRPFLTVSDSRGTRRRIRGDGESGPLTESELKWIGATLVHGNNISAPTLLSEGDTYYFSHLRYCPMFPVYRYISNDESRTRFYIDAVDATLRRRIANAEREYRWLHKAIHRFDFIKGRPLWDMVVLTLMTGEILICATGVILGVRFWQGKCRVAFARLRKQIAKTREVK